MKDTAEDKRQRSIIRPLRCSFQVLRVVGNIPEAACFHRPLSLSRPLVSDAKNGSNGADIKVVAPEMTPKMAAPEMTPEVAVLELTPNVVSPEMALDVDAPYQQV